MLEKLSDSFYIIMFQKAEKVETEIMSHWHPNLTICLVTDQTNWTKGSLPQPFNECKIIILIHCY